METISIVLWTLAIGMFSLWLFLTIRRQFVGKEDKEESK